jgi:hypothetical protein
MHEMRRVLVLSLVMLAAGAVVRAHHSFNSYYFENQILSFSGQISELEYVSPHAWVHFSAVGKDGVERTYSAEWASPARLGRAKIDRDTLKPGDVVVITASPSRDPGSNKLHLKTIHRPSDGWRWTGRNDNTPR